MIAEIPVPSYATASLPAIGYSLVALTITSIVLARRDVTDLRATRERPILRPD